MTNNAETGKLFGGVILKMLELVKMGASFVGVPFCVETYFLDLKGTN